MKSKHTPTAMLYSRQNTKNLGIDGRKALKGGYVIRESFKETPDVILMATGSEVGLVYDAYDVLKEIFTVKRLKELMFTNMVLIFSIQVIARYGSL